MNEELAREKCRDHFGEEITGCPLNFGRYRECLQKGFNERAEKDKERLNAIAKIKSDLDEKADFLASRRTCPPEADIEALRTDFTDRVAPLRRIVPEIKTLKGQIIHYMRVDISDAFFEGLLGGTLERWLRWVPVDEASFDDTIEPLEQKSWELDELEEDITNKIVCRPIASPPQTATAKMAMEVTTRAGSKMVVPLLN